MDASEKLLGFEPLTQRELEILALISDGLSNREIAQRLFLSVYTVKWYNKQLFSKLGANSRTQAVSIARQYSLLDKSASSSLAETRPRHNLPLQRTSFLGREEEIADLVGYLTTATPKAGSGSEMRSRLVTLTGPGGVGKTRLAVQAAAHLVEAFPDGVWLIDFAPLSDPALVLQTVAAILGLSEEGGHSRLSNLSSHLRPRTSLLVLDNCEHLIGAIADLAAELLQACPNVSILATSREPLEIPGEIPFLINPLSIPDRNPLLSSENLIEYAGVRLFIERAQTILPGFKLTAGNSSAIAEVCRRLDGLPLAIELAAARVKVLDVTEIASRLSGSYRLLGHGDRTALPRSQTLEACIGWSYDLLSGEERLLFKRLAVFVGGWTLEAVENVCTDETIRPVDAFDLLAQLVEKSLVVVVHWQDGTRYRFLETIHQYALEKLTSSGEIPAFKEKHLDYFLRMIEKAKFEDQERVRFDVLDRVDADHDNLRAALEWSLTNPANSTITVRLLKQLGRFWKNRGYLEEGRQRLSAFLAMPEASAPTVERAELLCQSAWLATYQSDIQAAKPLLEESLRIFRQLHPMGMRGEVDVLINLASIEIDGGEARIAVEHTQKALEISERIDYPGGVSGAHHLMGVALGQMGDYEQAWKHFESSLLLDRKIGRPVHINLLQNMGELAVRKGEYEKGEAYLQESLQLAIESKQKWDISANLGTQGWAALRLGKFGQARQLLRESLEVRHEIGDKGGIAWCLEKLAEVAARQGEPGKAVLLLGQASSLRLEIDSQVNSADRPDYDRLLSSLREQMEPAAFQAAWDMGANLLLDDAIEKTLEE